MSTSTILPGLTQAESEALRAQGKVLALPAKAFLFQAGDGRSGISLLLQGRVRIYVVSQDGRELTLDYLDPGAFLGLGGWSGAERILSARAMVGCEVLHLERERFQKLLGGSQALAALVLGQTVAWGDRLVSRLDLLLHRDVTQRLATLVLELAERYGTVAHPRGQRLLLTLTHMEMGRSIGATRETVSATIGKLRRNGTLAGAGRQVVISDEARLRAFAGLL